MTYVEYTSYYMFGSEYASYPKIILGDFGNMTKQYKKQSQVPVNTLLQQLYPLYIKIFGIPEIGFQIRVLYFRQMLKKISVRPQAILDAGCGIGYYSMYLHKYFPQASITGCDIEKNKIRFCQRLARDRKIDGDIQFIPLNLESQTLKKNSYDLIVNIDVLEHLKYYKKAIRNFYQALKPKGFLYIHTPQTNQKRFFRSLTTWSHEGHAREGFVPSELMKLLEQSGFKVVFIKNTHGFFGALAWELNHLSLSNSFFLAGLLYPVLYLLARLDVLRENKTGLGISMLIQKK